ncbi:unnamed protein product [Urochloa humidicola]
MRPSLITVVTLLAAAAACLAQAGAEPTTPRRSITTPGLSPTGPSSDDLDWCWESLLTLGLCKHDILAARPAPGECCLADDEAGHHCGPFARAFLNSVLPRGLMAECAHPAPAATGAGGAPMRLPSQRRTPPRAHTLETGPRASSGAQPPAPKARTGTLPEIPTERMGPPASSVRT